MSELKLVMFSFGISIAIDVGLIYFTITRNYTFFKNLGTSIEKFENILINLMVWGLFWGLNSLIFKALQFEQENAFSNPIKGVFSGFMIGAINGFIAGWFSGIISVDYFWIPNWSLICSSFAAVSTAILGWFLGTVSQRTNFSNS